LLCDSSIRYKALVQAKTNFKSIFFVGSENQCSWRRRPLFFLLGMGAATERCLVEHVRVKPFKAGSIAPDQVMVHRPPDVPESPVGIFAEFSIEDAVANIYAGIADANIRPTMSLRTAGSAWLLPQNEHLGMLAGWPSFVD